MGDEAMSPDTIMTDRATAETDQQARDQRLGALPAREPSPAAGPLSGLERAAFFAALRRKANQRLAEFG